MKLKSVGTLACLISIFLLGESCSSGSGNGGNNGNSNGGSAGGSSGTFSSGGSGVSGSGGGSGSVGGSSGSNGSGGSTGSSGSTGSKGSSGSSGMTGSSSGTGSSGTGSTSSGSSTGSSSSANPGDSGVTIQPDGSISAPPDVAGCAPTVKLYKTSDDMTAPGPWPVGVKTVQLLLDGVMANVEVWYPAPLGSNVGKSQATWDLRNWLPSGMGSMIPDSANHIVVCDGSNNSAPCYRDLPIDTTHGPYPAVIFIHGTGSFRLASGSAMSEWASRGFIAVAADHPGLFLTDFLASGSCQGGGTGTTQTAGSLNAQDVTDEINALTSNSSGPFAFLGNSVDMSRIGISGHSQGASGAATAASQPNVQVDMPLADGGGTVPRGSSLKSALFMGGMNDSVVAYSSDTSAYTGTTASIKRVIGITGGNHLDVTDLCTQTNSMGQTGIQIADMYMVCGSNASLVLLNSLAQCGTVMPVAAGPEIVNYATSATLEETLHCVDRSAAFSMLQTQFSQVGDFQHTP
jgi:hypothetical protein